MSRLAQAVQQQVDELRRARRGKDAAMGAAHTGGTRMTTKRETTETTGKADAATTKKREKKQKRRRLFIGDGAMAIVARLLDAALAGGDLSADERREAQTLRTRIAARGAGAR